MRPPVLRKPSIQVFNFLLHPVIRAVGAAHAEPGMVPGQGTAFEALDDRLYPGKFGLQLRRSDIHPRVGSWG